MGIYRSIFFDLQGIAGFSVLCRLCIYYCFKKRPTIFNNKHSDCSRLVAFLDLLLLSLKMLVEKPERKLLLPSKVSKQALLQLDECVQEEIISTQSFLKQHKKHQTLGPGRKQPICKVLQGFYKYILTLL